MSHPLLFGAVIAFGIINAINKRGKNAGAETTKTKATGLFGSVLNGNSGPLLGGLSAISGPSNSQLAGNAAIESPAPNRTPIVPPPAPRPPRQTTPIPPQKNKIPGPKPQAGPVDLSGIDDEPGNIIPSLPPAHEVDPIPPIYVEPIQAHFSDVPDEIVPIVPEIIDPVPGVIHDIPDAVLPLPPADDALSLPPPVLSDIPDDVLPLAPPDVYIDFPILHGGIDPVLPIVPDPDVQPENPVLSETPDDVLPIAQEIIDMPPELPDYWRDEIDRWNAIDFPPEVESPIEIPDPSTLPDVPDITPQPIPDVVDHSSTGEVNVSSPIEHEPDAGPVDAAGNTESEAGHFEPAPDPGLSDVDSDSNGSAPEPASGGNGGDVGSSDSGGGAEGGDSGGDSGEPAGGDDPFRTSGRQQEEY